MTAEYDVHRKSYKYSIDDWQLLVNLLHEYSEKLLDISRKLPNSQRESKLKNRKKINTIKNQLVIAFSIIIPLIFLVYKNPTWIDYAKNHPESMAALSGVFLAGLMHLAEKKEHKENILHDLFLNIELMEKDGRVISSRLESAIRLTIAIADQVEISLAKKLEMDLRINDASYALECYYAVSGEEPSAYQTEYKHSD
jgi:hypothetical protein